ncbi:beta-fructofuranosidase, insoluble isoenzyme CWINV3-like [Quercus lobata]|uniref:beta-fructofuranosidase, insoluble isoenzyme CWINV3-like n=1 Tax=Quercus lobata TaxID=97700 RepID=UPI0012459F7D|nr:beta-fructofuranosidase, insoluble isoenzyme CWINV3-like [Quercus lobata]
MEMSVLWSLALCFLLVGNGVHVEASNHTHRNLQSLPKEQPYRTAYHFQPLKNWMNDPNGPMYYEGVYHLFFQHNPYAPVPRNIAWGHSISYDLVNWVHLEPAISPSEPYDINGCWSGSTTILPSGKPAILYTGVDLNNSQVQNLAMPKNASDPFLREWVKSPHNPLMSPVDDIDRSDFRDPTTAWQGPDKVWRVIIGGRINALGMAFLYQSKDFVNWTRSNKPLHSSTKTGMWECPDFYPVRINSQNGINNFAQDKFTKHVLKASFNGQDHYILGNYIPQTDNFSIEYDFMETGFDLRNDYGKFYASKTFYDSAKKRRILWSWVAESDTALDAIIKGWAGIQSFPRSIVLSANGRQLVQWPINEIEKLRTNNVSFESKELQQGSVFEVSGITASQADVEVSFDLPNLSETESIDPNQVDPQQLCSQKGASTNNGTVGPFGLLALASKDLTEQTAVYFRIFKRDGKHVVLMCSDQSRSSLREGLEKPIYGAFVNIDPNDRKISLRSLIDHSIIENFGGEGRTCITARVYPKLAIDKEARLYVFNNGTLNVRISKLNAWSMKRAQLVPYQKEMK